MAGLRANKMVAWTCLTVLAHPMGAVALSFPFSRMPSLHDLQEAAAPADQRQTEVTVKSIISKRVDFVVLHVGVFNNRGRRVEWTKDHFRVWEDKIPQEVEQVAAQPQPITLGLLIDDSISVSGNRELMVQALEKLRQSQRPEDEVFPVMFGSEVSLPLKKGKQNFLTGPGQLEGLLAEYRPDASSTHLYDALYEAITFAKKKGSREKKVLLLVSDGDNNGGLRTLEDTINYARRAKVYIYAVALPAETDRQRGASEALERMTRETGGLVYPVKSVDQVGQACERAAKDIRDQILIAYVSTNSNQDGKFRKVNVEACDRPCGEKGSKRLKTRTAKGYYAPLEGTGENHEND